jgi:hypothetical protein
MRASAVLHQNDVIDHIQSSIATDTSRHTRIDHQPWCNRSAYLQQRGVTYQSRDLERKHAMGTNLEQRTGLASKWQRVTQSPVSEL